MAIASQKDFVSGLMFMVVGGGFAWGAIDYEIGEAARMGPGYFPMVLGLVLVLLGSFIMFFALVVETPDGGSIGDFAWRPLFCILGANVLFGVLLGGLPMWGLPSMGLMVAIYALCGLALLADPNRFTLRRWLVPGGMLFDVKGIFSAQDSDGRL